MIGCGGVAVIPGDILVGDEDGVILIPRALAAEIARDGADQERLESFLTSLIADADRLSVPILRMRRPALCTRIGSRNRKPNDLGPNIPGRAVRSNA